MAKIGLSGLLVATLSTGSFSAFAHHAVPAVYDLGRTVTMEGTVRKFRFVNPHVLMTFDAVDEHGDSVAWTVEFDGVLNLTRSGWASDTIPAGASVKVTGYPARSGTRRIFFARLTFADGKELIRPAIERVDAIDAERLRERGGRPTLEFPE